MTVEAHLEKHDDGKHRKVHVRRKDAAEDIDLVLNFPSVQHVEYLRAATTAGPQFNGSKCQEHCYIFDGCTSCAFERYTGHNHNAV